MAATKLMIKKTNNIRAKKYTAAAKGQRCVRCGGVDTVCLAHYTGQRQFHYGKGRGIKGHDLIGADLCNICHEYFDQFKWKEAGLTADQASEEFLHLCFLTVVRRYHQGVLKIT